MVTDVSIKKGYKQTELGVIPEDWIVKSLGEVCIKIQDGNYGGSYPKSNEFISYGIPFLTSKAIGTDGTLKRELIDYISEKKHSELNKAHLKLNDVLFTNRGASVGAIGFVTEDICHGNIGPQLTLLRANEDFTSSQFLYHMMKSEVVQKQILSQDSGSAMNFFSIGSTKKFLLTFPKKKLEQTTITAVLFNADVLIENLEKLIAKKKAIKQGAMQQLLTGKKRLPGFSGEWRVNSIQELEKENIIKLSRGKVISKKDIDQNPGNNPIYSSSIHNNGEFGRYGGYMFDEELITWSVDGGGNFFYRPKHKYSVTNVCGYIRVDNKRINYKFLALQLQLLHSRLFFDYTMKAHPSVIRKAYKVAIPKMEEQVAIATILSDMDEEIESLEQKREKYVMIKQGMMQQLLTGKIRIYANN